MGIYTKLLNKKYLKTLGLHSGSVVGDVTGLGFSWALGSVHGSS